MTSTHFRTCHLCDAMCGTIVTVDDGKPTSVRGDPDDVFSRGHICPKGPAIRDLHDDPDRLRTPMRRTARGFEPISWDEALDEAADGLSRVQRAHGTNAVACYGGNPMAHNHGGALGWQAVLAALGTQNRFDANSQDSNPKIFAAMQMYGDGLSITVPDIDRTDYLLMIGANPAVSMGSVMTLGDVRARLRSVRERGGKMVLVDPRRNETAALCDEHHFVRPGTDAYLLLSLLHALFASPRIDIPRLDRVARGTEALRAITEAFPPERTEHVTGMGADVVTRLASELLSARRAVVYGRVGMCQSEQGVLASWLVEAVNVVTGNFDREGGMMFPKPAVDIGPVARLLLGNRWGRYRSRVRSLPELAGSLPSTVMAEEMDTPGPGQVRGFVTYAGNPVLSTPNTPRLDRALAGLEFMVSVDYYINETTRHANVVLPPCSPLECPHFDLLMPAVAVRNTVKYSEAVLPPRDDAPGDYEILTRLAARIAARRSAGAVRASHHAVQTRLERAIPSLEGLIDTLLRLGPYGDRYLPWSNGLNLARVRREVHGIDLGPLKPAGKDKVRTRDGRVDLAPEVYVREALRLRDTLDAKRPRFLLVGRRHLRSNNSWMHNLASLVRGSDRTALLVNPDDARELGLADGARVRVSNDRGSLVARVEITDDIMRGVVSLPHGFGHEMARDTMRIAGEIGGPNPNVLTDDQRVESILGDSILTGVPVKIEAE